MTGCSHACRARRPETRPASGAICSRQPNQNSGKPCSRTISGPSPALDVMQPLIADLGVTLRSSIPSCGIRLLNVPASGFGATETEPASDVDFPNDVPMRSPFSRRRSGIAIPAIGRARVDPGAFTGRALNHPGKAWLRTQEADPRSDLRRGRGRRAGRGATAPCSDERASTPKAIECDVRRVWETAEPQVTALTRPEGRREQTA
jgi:hypothetical protein